MSGGVAPRSATVMRWLGWLGLLLAACGGKPLVQAVSQAAASGPATAAPTARAPAPPAVAVADVETRAKVAKPHGWPVSFGRWLSGAVPTSDGGAVVRLAVDRLDSTDSGELVGLDATGHERWRVATFTDDPGGRLWSGPKDSVRFVDKDGAIAVVDAATGKARATIAPPADHVVRDLIDLGAKSLVLLEDDDTLSIASLDAADRIASLRAWPALTYGDGDRYVVASDGVAAWWGGENSFTGQTIRFVRKGKPEQILLTDELVVGVHALSRGRFDVMYPDHAIVVTPALCPARARRVLSGAVSEADWRDLCSNEPCPEASRACALARREPRGVIDLPGAPGFAERAAGGGQPAQLLDARTGAVLATMPEYLESWPLRQGKRILGVILRAEGSFDRASHTLCELGVETASRCVAVAGDDDGAASPGDTTFVIVRARAFVCINGTCSWTALP